MLNAVKVKLKEIIYSIDPDITEGVSFITGCCVLMYLLNAL